MGVDKKDLLAAWMWTEKRKENYWQCWCGQKNKSIGYVGVDRKDLMLRECGQKSTGCVDVEKWYTGYVGVDKKGLLAAWVWTKVYWLCGRGQNGSTVCMGVDQYKSTEWVGTLTVYWMCSLCGCLTTMVFNMYIRM